MDRRQVRWVAVLALVALGAGCLLEPGPSEQPDPNKRLSLDNEYHESVTVDVELVRDATNRTVHRESYEVAAGTERTLTSTARADPDGVERFTFRLHALNQTTTVRVETSECYGGAFAVVHDDGRLTATYSIC